LHLLGSSGWYGREFLLNAKNQAEGSAFSTAFFENHDESFKTFSEKFKAKWHRDPDDHKVAGLSYDAIRIINSALQSSSGPLTAAISQKKEYDGVYGKIIFSENGANSSVALISVTKGKLVEKSPECEVNR
jgi:ABC-type branched-subunit amino acid transport system substrate-binding protein